jgi:hypothetical protein
MQNEIILRDHFPEVKEEIVKLEAKRRLEYSIARDLQAKKENEAIAKRFAREEKNQG